MLPPLILFTTGSTEVGCLDLWQQLTFFLFSVSVSPPCILFPLFLSGQFCSVALLFLRSSLSVPVV